MKMKKTKRNDSFSKMTLIIAAIAVCPFILTQCATGGDPVGEGVEDLGETIEENLPGLGPNPTSVGDEFTR